MAIPQEVLYQVVHRLVEASLLHPPTGRTLGHRQPLLRVAITTGLRLLTTHTTHCPRTSGSRTVRRGARRGRLYSLLHQRRQLLPQVTEPHQQPQATTTTTIIAGQPILRTTLTITQQQTLRAGLRVILMDLLMTQPIFGGELTIQQQREPPSC